MRILELPESERYCLDRKCIYRKGHSGKHSYEKTPPKRPIGKAFESIKNTLSSAEKMEANSHIFHITNVPNGVAYMLKKTIGVLKDTHHPPKSYDVDKGIIILENDVIIHFMYINLKDVKGLEFQGYFI